MGIGNRPYGAAFGDDVLAHAPALEGVSLIAFAEQPVEVELGRLGVLGVAEDGRALAPCEEGVLALGDDPGQSARAGVVSADADLRSSDSHLIAWRVGAATKAQLLLSERIEPLPAVDVDVFLEEKQGGVVVLRKRRGDAAAPLGVDQVLGRGGPAACAMHEAEGERADGDEITIRVLEAFVHLIKTGGAVAHEHTERLPAVEVEGGLKMGDVGNQVPISQLPIDADVVVLAVVDHDLEIDRRECSPERVGGSVLLRCEIPTGVHGELAALGACGGVELGQ